MYKLVHVQVVFLWKLLRQIIKKQNSFFAAWEKSDIDCAGLSREIKRQPFIFFQIT